MTSRKTIEGPSHDGDTKESEMPNGIEAFHQVKDNVNEQNKSKGVGSNEFRSTNEPRQEFVSGNAFDWKPLVFSEINGIAIFEGDIDLGTVEEMQNIRSPGTRD
jgi:hypothetical protein